MEPRIKIFSISGCPHCEKAKRILKAKGWNYVDISLDYYPEKRKDMLKITNQLTVPQIFFGSIHIGGASDLEQFEKEGRLSGSYDGVDSNITSEPLLEKPNYQPKEKPSILPRGPDQ